MIFTISLFQSPWDLALGFLLGIIATLVFGAILTWRERHEEHA